MCVCVRLTLIGRPSGFTKWGKCPCFCFVSIHQSFTDTMKRLWCKLFGVQLQKKPLRQPVSPSVGALWFQTVCGLLMTWGLSQIKHRWKEHGLDFNDLRQMTQNDFSFCFSKRESRLADFIDASCTVCPESFHSDCLLTDLTVEILVYQQKFALTRLDLVDCHHMNLLKTWRLRPETFLCTYTTYSHIWHLVRLPWKYSVQTTLSLYGTSCIGTAMKASGQKDRKTVFGVESPSVVWHLVYWDRNKNTDQVLSANLN